MKIGILSGKGGAGKTTVAVNLADIIENSLLIDTDVEEPNVHLYFKKDKFNIKDVDKHYPVVNRGLCILCGRCGDFCNFNAIIPAKNEVLVFKESCHDCGGCKIVCDHNAIQYEKRTIGKIYDYISGDQEIRYGELNIGELSGVSIIKELKENLDNDKINIIDCPPGVACSTVAAVHGIDYAVIVAEESPFGLSDMKMVVELLNDMNIRFSVLINKAGLGDSSVKKYCKESEIDIVGELEFNERLAWYSARGDLINRRMPNVKETLSLVAEKITDGDHYE